LSESDFYIIGAGPAGVSLAYFLSQKGFNVELFEARPRVGEKPCGGGVPIEINQWFPVPEESIINKISTLEMYYNDRELGSWSANRVIFLLVDRTKYLESYINEDGIKLHLSKTVKVHDNNEFVVDGRKLDPSKVIIATGSVWRLQEREMLAHTLQYIIEDVHIEDPDAMKFFFYENLVGYAWLFPLGRDKVKVGIGSINKSINEMENLLNEIIIKHNLKGNIIKKEGAPIDMGGLKPEWGGGPPYAVGEAIGAVMPITGEGIRPSIITSHTLVEALVSSKDYKKLLQGLTIYKASRLQRKMLEKVLKHNEKLDLHTDHLSSKTIQLIYKLGMGEIGFKDLLTLATKLPWLLKGLI